MMIPRILLCLFTGLVLCLNVCPVLAFCSASAHTAQVVPQEAEQVLFLIDNSGSMSERGFDPAQPLATRWDISKQVIPKWMGGLAEDVRVGAVSVGGSCGSPPQINLPVGAERKDVAAAIDSTSPNGQTNLNAVLEASPGYFSKNVQGRKRIVLLSDGLNSCSPMASTCEIVRSLNRDHGISVDVVAWVTDPGMIQEFQCVAQASGGTFYAPATVKEFLNIPLFNIDPWRYIVLILGLLTLILASRILYSHCHHALGCHTQRAVLSATLLFGLGALALYLVLFAGAGLGSAILGALVLLGTFLMAGRQTRSAPVSAGPGGSVPWTILLLVSLMLIPGHLLAADRQPLDAERKYPAYHHILVLDMSGSVSLILPEMKEFVAEYAERFVVADEEISLLTFSYDDKGSVKEICTFTVPKTRQMAVLTRALDDLAIQDSRKTRTYFRPLADYLNIFLKRVRLQPVVLALSDGKSDGFEDAAKGRVNFKEIPFESLATRGIYQLPGTNNWKIAIQGGAGLDFKALFRKPPVPKNSSDKKSRLIDSPPKPLGPIIDPCLIEPALRITVDDKIIFLPRLNPLTRVADASITIRASNECVARFRSFKAELSLADGEVIEIGAVRHTIIDQNSKAFTFPVTLPVDKLTMKEATLRVTLEQGSAVQAIYAEPGAPAVELISYWSSFGKYWLLGGGALLLSVGSLLLFTKRHVRTKRNKPMPIQALGGSTAILTPLSPLTLGGEGASLSLAGVPAGLQLGMAEHAGSSDEVRLRAQNGFHMRVAGMDAPDGCTYRLGQPLEFYSNESSYQLVLYPGKKRDVGRNISTASFTSEMEGFPNFTSSFNDSFTASDGNGSGAPLI